MMYGMFLLLNNIPCFYLPLVSGSRFPHPGTKKRDPCLAAKVSSKSQLETSALSGPGGGRPDGARPGEPGELLPFDMLIIAQSDLRRNGQFDKSLTFLFVHPAQSPVQERREGAERIGKT